MGTVAAAAQFRASMAILNLSNGVGALSAGPDEWEFGIVNAEGALGCLQLAIIDNVLAIDPHQERRS